MIENRKGVQWSLLDWRNGGEMVCAVCQVERLKGVEDREWVRMGKQMQEINLSADNQWVTPETNTNRHFCWRGTGNHSLRQTLFELSQTALQMTLTHSKLIECILSDIPILLT